MNYDTYIDLISKEKYREATLYKSSCIPDKLYKYFWLDNNLENNEMRLSTLEKGQIYLSSLEQFNDPFEGKAIVFDEKELMEKGWQKKVFQDFIDLMNSRTRICCFANPTEKQQNMPMWAYYANNHQGFCVEYEITEKQKKYIYPVSYDEKRANGNALIGNLINGIIDMIHDGKDSSQMPGEISAYNHMAYLSLTCKHISWQHEKEFRALVPIEYGQFLSAIPCKIYIGMNCSTQNRNRLVEIAAKHQNCEIYQEQGTIDKNDFFLQEIRIL